MQLREVAILNRSTALSDADARLIVAALQAQVENDFAPVWGVGAQLSYIPTGVMTGWEGKWNITLLDTYGQAGPLGYHELTPDGLPLGKVFVKDDLTDGTEPSVTISHELLELLGNPHANLLVLDTTKPDAPVFYAYENCDAVGADACCYEVNGVKVSNFVLPHYFDPGATAGPFDLKEHLTAALSVAPGGYMSVLDMTAKQWTTVPTGNDPTRPGGGSRKERRAMPRSDWRLSHT